MNIKVAAFTVSEKSSNTYFEFTFILQVKCIFHDADDYRRKNSKMFHWTLAQVRFWRPTTLLGMMAHDDVFIPWLLLKNQTLRWLQERVTTSERLFYILE